MFTTTILTSWAACPQSRLYHEAVAGGDRRAARALTLVARQWDHTLAPGWVLRVLPRRLQPRHFDPADYGVVLCRVSVPALEATLDQVDWLRRQPPVRRSLRSVAFLEAFEGAVAAELTQRRGHWDRPAAPANAAQGEKAGAHVSALPAPERPAGAA